MPVKLIESTTYGHGLGRSSKPLILHTLRLHGRRWTMSATGWFAQRSMSASASSRRSEDRSFDRVSSVEHPSGVSRLVQRLAALALAFGLVAGNAAAICAGWLPTPEARMACCADGAECPMHKGDSHSSASQRVLTQAQADSCCAAAEGQNSNQSNPSFVTVITAAVLGVGVILPANVPALVLSDAWRTSAPIPIAPVPKHVLLSVYLV
jgi:hypothetical protein